MRFFRLQFLKHPPNLFSSLQDFIATQAPYKSLMEEWYNSTAQKTTLKQKTSQKKFVKKELKTSRRGSKSILKMKERKEQKQRHNYALKEYVSNGEKHFLVVKKKTEDKDEVEDIFADWNKNLSIIKRPRAIRPRVRKISHRQERKSLLHAEEAKIEEGPFTYAQTLRKGLRLPAEQEKVEDIFQSWRMFLDELTGMVNGETKEPEADELDIFKVWRHNLHVPADQPEDVEILSSTNPELLPSLDCGQPTVKKMEIKKRAPKKNVTPPSKKKPTEAPHKMLAAKQDDVKPQVIPIPPPPPSPAKKPYEAVEKHKQIVPFVERKIAFTIPTPPPMPPKALPPVDLTSTPVILKPTTDFKPSANSQRMFAPPKPSVPKKMGPKQQPTAEQIYVAAKKSSSNLSWQSMLIPMPDASGRGDSKRKLPSKPEEVFQNWRYIFAEENTKDQPATEGGFDVFDGIFKEWAEVNLKEPEQRKRRESENSESPKATRKEAKKLIKSENIDDDIMNAKDSRRQDFARNGSIKNKKKGEAARNATGKRIK